MIIQFKDLICSRLVLLFRSYAGYVRYRTQKINTPCPGSYNLSCCLLEAQWMFAPFVYIVRVSQLSWMWKDGSQYHIIASVWNCRQFNRYGQTRDSWKLSQTIKNNPGNWKNREDAYISELVHLCKYSYFICKQLLCEIQVNKPSYFLCVGNVILFQMPPLLLGSNAHHIYIQPTLACSMYSHSNGKRMQIAYWNFPISA